MKPTVSMLRCTEKRHILKTDDMYRKFQNQSRHDIMTRFLSTTLPFALILCYSALAQSGSDSSPKWFEGVSFNGFVSSAFTYNFNKPVDGHNSFRAFDTRHNSFSIDVFELAVQRDASEVGDAGFRVDVTAGSTIPQATHSSGMNTGDFDLQQAYVSWNAPLGDGLHIDFGKFATHLGYELIDGYDGFNDNYSRSFLFGYAIPFTHTGIRARYDFSSSLSFAALVVNGWDNAVDNNSSKSIGGQLSASPLSGLNLYANYIFGPERDGNNSANRSVLDICASYAPSEALTVGINIDMGNEDDFDADNSAGWNGFAAYLRYSLCPAFAVAARAEMFDDKDGARSGTKQKLTEFTITPEYCPSPGLAFRLEFRMDMSDKKVFVKDGEPVDSQSTLAFNGVFFF